MALGTLVRLIDRPGQAMQDVVDHPKSWWLPAVLLLLSMLALIYVSLPYTVEMANEVTEQTFKRLESQLSEEQMEVARERSKPMTEQRMLLTSGITLGIMIPLGWLVRGGLVHFSSMAMGGHSTWPGTYAACVWAMMPFFVRDIVQIIWITVQKAGMQHAGLAFLVASGDTLADTRNLTYQALAQVDPFALWHLILLGAAIHVACKIKKGQAAILALVVWLVITAVKVLPSYLGSTMLG